jgi:hypothetical protein
MATTFVVYNLLLREHLARPGDDVPWSNEILHVLGAALLSSTGCSHPAAGTSRGALWTIAIFPLAWAVYSMIRGAIVGWYPYPFLNPAQEARLRRRRGVRHRDRRLHPARRRGHHRAQPHAVAAEPTTPAREPTPPSASRSTACRAARASASVAAAASARRARAAPRSARPAVVARRQQLEHRAQPAGPALGDREGVHGVARRADDERADAACRSSRGRRRRSNARLRGISTSRIARRAASAPGTGRAGRPAGRRHRRDVVEDLALAELLGARGPASARIWPITGNGRRFVGQRSVVERRPHEHRAAHGQQVVEHDAQAIAAPIEMPMIVTGSDASWCRAPASASAAGTCSQTSAASRSIAKSAGSPTARKPPWARTSGATMSSSGPPSPCTGLEHAERLPAVGAEPCRSTVVTRAHPAVRPPSPRRRGAVRDQQLVRRASRGSRSGRRRDRPSGIAARRNGHEVVVLLPHHERALGAEHVLLPPDLPQVAARDAAPRRATSS